MTKLEKNRNYVLNDMDKRTYLTKDTYGNYIYNDNKLIRWHPKKSVICKQKKIDKSWYNINSIYYKDMIINIKNNK